MRITIEIDEKRGAVVQTQSAVPSAPQAVEPPSDVLALAAATGAINGGPAPDGDKTATTGAAISAGSAAQARPCP